MDKKKICALSLASCLVASSINAFAYVPSIDDVPFKSDFLEDADVETIESAGLDAAFGLLSYIGVVDESEEKDISLAATKTRAARYFAAIKGTKTGGESLPYSDVDENTENYQWILAAYSYGIIEKADKFYPAAKLTPEEAALMAMNTLGYNRMYSKESVMSFAAEYELFKGVDIKNGELTVGGLWRVIENTLAIPCLDFSLVSSGDYSIKEGEKSYLEEKKNIIIQSGVVTAVGFSSIYGDSDLEENRIEINRGVFDCVFPPDTGMVGKTVRAYVDVSEGEYSLISIWEYKNSCYEFLWDEVEYIEKHRNGNYRGKKI